MNTLEHASRAIAEADCILIGAGAGLSASAGLDYSDEKSFAAYFPGMLQYGARNQYQLMGYPFRDEALKWGYQAAALDLVYKTGPTQPYQDLKALVDGRDYFVITSNVDRFFHKNGFAEDQIYTPQGDYEWLQCLTPCRDQLWDAKAPVGAMMKSLNPETQMIRDRDTLPVCPNCGGPVFMNVRGGHWFVENRYQDGARRMADWISDNSKRQMAIIEIGCGYNTPGVVRWPLEALGKRLSNATHIRINRDHPERSEHGISLSLDAAVALRKLQPDLVA